MWARSEETLAPPQSERRQINHLGFFTNASNVMACLLLQRINTTSMTMMTIQMKLARRGAEPGYASGSCPSGGPPSPRISAIKAASRLTGRSLFIAGKRMVALIPI